MGAGRVKGMDAAGGAESVARHAGVEAVGGERGVAPDQPELRGFHDQVKESFLGADGTVALGDLGYIGDDFEPHASAMAAALVCQFHVRLLPPGLRQTQFRYNTDSPPLDDCAPLTKARSFISRLEGNHLLELITAGKAPTPLEKISALKKSFAVIEFALDGTIID